MSSSRVRFGVIGCGAISPAYFGMAKNFPIVEVAACADLDVGRAMERAKEFNVPKACSVSELLDDPSIEVVINLTVPKAHVPVSLEAVAKGKHVYLEKPLGINRAEGQRLIDAATARGVRIGCAPDTFLGAGIQTARKLIDDGAIGKPVAFTAFMLSAGHEGWHPSPEFYYEVGGGPMFDMGPYYLTALLNLLGPARRLSGSATIAIPQRTILSEPKRGKRMTVQTPDHICGTIEFHNGAAGTIMTSFATRFSTQDGKQPITIYGTEGTLKVPDPNTFDGPVSIRRVGQENWEEVAPTFLTGYGRSVGAADLAYAIRSGRPHRANGELAMAVLDLMQGFLDSSEQGTHHTVTTPFTRPAPMPAELPFGTLDE